MKRIHIIGLVFITFICNYMLDRVGKIFAELFLKNNESINLFFDIVILKYAENNGAFLSLGSNWNQIVKYIMLLIVPIIICILAILYCCIKENDKVRVILIVTIASGGLSNLVDRLLNNFNVIDFLNFGILQLRTGILNIADLSITFGAIILIIYEYTKRPNNIVQ